MANNDVAYTLEEAVNEVLLLLTGLTLEYTPDSERFHSIARCINKALRSVALEHEWSYFSSTENLGPVSYGMQEVELSSRLRPRIINDDAVRFVDAAGQAVLWAYILPRDALHKYSGRGGLWASVTRSTLRFNRPLTFSTDLQIEVPVMREPLMFEIPAIGEEVAPHILGQLLDFDYPDLVISRAAFIYAQSDPVMQPRVQTLEAQYKDIMYQLIERDDRHSDTPYQNEYGLPMQSSVSDCWFGFDYHQHPHADERGF